MEAALGEANHTPRVGFDSKVSGLVEDWLEENLHGDIAGSTEATYAGAWRNWVIWCNRQGDASPVIHAKDDLRIAEDRIIRYLGYLGWLGASANSLKQAIFALKSGHKRLGMGDPTAGKHRLWILVAGMSKRAVKKARRLGVTKGMLEWLASALAPSPSHSWEENFDGTMLNAAIQMAWFLMLRMKEYGDSGGVDPDMVMRGHEVRLSCRGKPCEPGEATEMTVEFRKTKTDQECFGISQAVHVSGDPLVCATRAADSLRTLAPQRFGEGSDALLPLFRWANGTVLKREEVQRALRQAAVGVGLPADRFMSHSLRIGGASALFQATGEVELVKRRGRWTSSAVQRYLHDELDAEVTRNVASMMASGGGGLQRAPPSAARDGSGLGAQGHRAAATSTPASGTSASGNVGRRRSAGSAAGSGLGALRHRAAATGTSASGSAATGDTDYDPDRVYDGNTSGLLASEGSTLGTELQRPPGTTGAGVSPLGARGHQAAATCTSASGTSMGSCMG